MSFDLFCISSHFSEAFEKRDPLTGELLQRPENLPLTRWETGAVECVLNALTEPTDAMDVALLQCNDGGRADVGTGELDKGQLHLSVQTLTPEMTLSIFRLLEAGRFLMCVPSGKPITVAVLPDAFERIPEGMPKKVLCSTPDELAALLPKTSAPPAPKFAQCRAASPSQRRQ